MAAAETNWLISPLPAFIDRLLQTFPKLEKYSHLLKGKLLNAIRHNRPPKKLLDYRLEYQAGLS